METTRPEGCPEGYEKCQLPSGCATWTPHILCNKCSAVPKLSTPDFIPLAHPTPDRSGCKVWCGRKTWMESDDKRMGRPTLAGFTVNGVGVREVWCTQACMTARVPPLPSSPVPVERRANVPNRIGQRYRRPGDKVVTIVSRQKDGYWLYEPRDITSNVVAEEWLTANWTLIADAPAPVENKLCDHGHRYHCADCDIARAIAAERKKAPPPRAHDFSDPYCATQYFGDVVRLCLACGRRYGSTVTACTPDSDWRKRLEIAYTDYPRPPDVASRPGELLDRRPHYDMASCWDGER